MLPIGPGELVAPVPATHEIEVVTFRRVERGFKGGVGRLSNGAWRQPLDGVRVVLGRYPVITVRKSPAFTEDVYDCRIGLETHASGQPIVINRSHEQDVVGQRHFPGDYRSQGHYLVSR